MSDTRERLRGMLEATAHNLEVIWHAADYGRDAGHGPASECETCREFFGVYVGDDVDPWEALRELPLENVWEVGEPHTIVLTTGGPHVEIRGSRRDDGYALYGYWGGEEIRVPASEAVERTAEWFREWS